MHLSLRNVVAAGPPPTCTFTVRLLRPCKPIGRPLKASLENGAASDSRPSRRYGRRRGSSRLYRRRPAAVPTAPPPPATSSPWWRAAETQTARRRRPAATRRRRDRRGRRGSSWHRRRRTDTRRLHLEGESNTRRSSGASNKCADIRSL